MKCNKKTIVASSAVGLLAIIGGTIAYHTSIGSFVNLFKIGRWQTVVTEEFASPDDWQPCSEIPKTVIGENTGNYKAVARLKYEEYWKLADSTSTNHETELPFVDGDGDRITNINLQNENDWFDGGDGWYYYNYVLEPGDTTSSLLKSVTLDCKVNFAGENQCTTSGNKTTCTKPENQYDGAKYHVFVTVELLQQDGCDGVWAGEQCAIISRNRNTLYHEITAVRSNNGLDTNVNFAQNASSTYADTNGAGLNIMASTSGDQYPIYYFRGDVKDNYVVWAGFCWKIVRTTNTGGTKMIYNGLSETNDKGKAVCPEVNDNKATIKHDSTETFTFSASGNSMTIGSVGYMFGDSIAIQDISTSRNSSWVFSKKVTKSGNTYILDTSEGQSVSGPWSLSLRLSSNRGYHYFCRTGAESCSYLDISYNISDNGITGIQFGAYGAKDIYEALEGASRNEHDSSAKIEIDSWFERNHLDGSGGGKNYEDELEDTVFCNDRSIMKGSLLGEEEYSGTSYFGAFARNDNEVYRTGVIQPSLDCDNKNDAFTKEDTVNGNGALKYKVALLTADEATLASSNAYPSSYSSDNYLYTTGSYYIGWSWTMSPAFIDGELPSVINIDYSQRNYTASTTRGLRPVVSLANRIEFVLGGKGTPSNPYVIRK